MATKLDIFGILRHNKNERKLMEKNLKKTIWQFIKFSAVGISNTLVDFAVYWLLTHLGTDYMLAQVFSYSAGILNSYIWNSKWTFRKENSGSFGTVILFILVNIISLGVSLGVLWICKNTLGINEDVVLSIFGLSIGISCDIICKIPASALSAVVNFALTKLFVFKKGKRTDKGENN